MQIQKLDTFGGHRDCVYALEQDTLANQFFSSGGDGQVVRWHLDHPDLGELVATVPASVYALARHPATELLWVGQNYNGLHLIDTTRKTEVGSLNLTTSAIFDIKFYAADAFIALGDGVVAVVDTDRVAVKKHIKSSNQSARCLAINPVERDLAVGYSDNSIRIFDLLTYELKQVIPAHDNSVFTLVYSPDFRFLLSGGRDAHLKIWEAEHQYELHQDIVAHLFAINHIVFSPDGTLFATASMDKALKIWDASQHKLLKVVDRARHAGHGTSVNKLLWTDYNQTLLSASDDRTISVWSVQKKNVS